MELAFNAAWFVLTVASYVLLVRQLAIRGPEHADSTNRVRLFVALSCVLAILFPVISLSDDLQEMQAAVQENSAPRLVMRKSGIDVRSKLEQKLHHASFVVRSLVTGVGWVSPEGIAARQIADSVPGLQQSTPSRAPPGFLIAQSG